MAIIVPTKALEAATALRLLKSGRATPEQQRLAFKHITGLPKEHAQKKITGSAETDRAVMVELMFRDALTESDEATLRDTCQFVADQCHRELSTIESGYHKWNRQDDALKKSDIQKYIAHLLDTWALYFEVQISEKTKVGKN